MQIVIHLEKKMLPQCRTNDIEECDCPACRDESNSSIRLDGMVEDFLIRTRRILVVGEINEIASTHICSDLQLLSLKKSPIYMYINTPGGCMGDGYAIIDQMELCDCPIYTIVRGSGHSMGAIIAAFGEKGHRYATPNSCLMLHSASVQGYSSPISIERHGEMIKYLTEDSREKTSNLAKRLKINAKKLMKLISEEKWMSPQQAIKVGLIDKIWTPQLEQTINRELIK